MKSLKRRPQAGELASCHGSFFSLKPAPISTSLKVTFNSSSQPLHFGCSALQRLVITLGYFAEYDSWRPWCGSAAVGMSQGNLFDEPIRSAILRLYVQSASSSIVGQFPLKGSRGWTTNCLAWCRAQAAMPS